MSYSYRFECNLPLPTLDECSKKIDLKHEIIHTNVVGGSLCSRDLMIFSTMESPNVEYHSIIELISDIMFKCKEKGIKYLDEAKKQIKINNSFVEDFQKSLDGSIFSDCLIGTFLKVNILIFKEYYSPKQLLEPLLFLDLLNKEEIGDWPIICVRYNDNKKFQTLSKAVLATKDNFTNFLISNIKANYDILVQEKLEIKIKYDRYMPAPYNSSDWDMIKTINDCLKNYSGIFVNEHKPIRKNHKILGLGTNKGCIISNAQPNKKLEGSKSILLLLRNYLFGKNKNNEFLILFHEIKQRMKFYQLIKQIEGEDLLLFLAVLSQSLKINLCFLKNQHLISFRNIINKNYLIENCSDPIIAIMEVDNNFYLVNKVTMADNRNLHFPIAHSMVEEIFFKYIENTNGNVLDVNLEQLCNDIEECDPVTFEKQLCNRTRFLKKLESHIADLSFRVRFPIHEKERYNAYCERIKQSNLDIFSYNNLNKNNVKQKNDISNVVKNEDIVNQQTNENDNDIFDRKQIYGMKRSYDKISEIENNHDGTINDNHKIDIEDELVDIETLENCINMDIESSSLQPPGKIEKGDKNIIMWIPNDDAFSFIRGMKPKDNEKVITRAVKVNWSNLIKKCLQKDPVTPKKYDIFKRNVFKIWEDIINQEMITQEDEYGKIELDVDGFDHLTDNGVEIIGMLSERKYTDQIIVKVNPTDHKINCLVYIYNLSMKTSLDNEDFINDGNKKLLNKCELFKHYYRCTNCKKIGDEYNKNLKLGKYESDIPEKPKGATIIKTFKGNLCIDTRMGKNKKHCKGCKPISLLLVLADQFDKKVKILSTKKYVTFEAAYQRMLAGLMELAEIHGIHYEMILEHCLPKDKLREQCVKLDEFYKTKQKSVVTTTQIKSYCAKKKGNKSLFR
ncbi:Hypothetical protein SRAE_1000303600 [Strongyloides ratti]|uniref:Uncharacterized protein n=1 Tax=Strongyloides ratti TaxID=34506 RepID=A0A090L9I8_STRRB|nr:Hypothetical protein SRAE_1000303600 [Strongyloides ratti]CEF64783.1 Hypothetical protein SRAE_1000303600 [Strongyloides ratti]